MPLGNDSKKVYFYLKKEDKEDPKSQIKYFSKRYPPSEFIVGYVTKVELAKGSIKKPDNTVTETDEVHVHLFDPETSENWVIKHDLSQNYTLAMLNRLASIEEYKMIKFKAYTSKAENSQKLYTNISVKYFNENGENITLPLSVSKENIPKPIERVVNNKTIWDRGEMYNFFYSFDKKNSDGTIVGLIQHKLEELLKDPNNRKKIITNSNNKEISTDFDEDFIPDEIVEDDGAIGFEPIQAF